MDIIYQEKGIEQPGETGTFPIRTQTDREERIPIEELLRTDSENEDMDSKQAEKKLKQLQNMRDEIIKQLEILDAQT